MILKSFSVDCPYQGRMLRSTHEQAIDVFVLKVILFSLYLTPALNVIPGIPSIRVDDLVPLVWGFAFFLRTHTGFTKVPGRVLLMLAFLLLLPVAIFNGEMGLYEVSSLDLNQYIRFAKYIFIYVLAFTVFRNCDEIERIKLLRYWILLSFLCFLLAVSQYIDFLGLNSLYVQRVAPTQYLSLMGGHPNPRPVAMIGNPNELGFLFVVSFMVALFLFGRDRRLFINSIYLAAALAGVLLTLSRGSLAALLGSFFVFSAVKSFFNKGVKPAGIFFGVLAVGGVVYFVFTSDFIYEKFLWRFERALVLSEDASFAARLHNWNENIAIIEKNFLVGVGPLSRANLQYSADNEWLLILRAYGVFGLAIFMWLILRELFMRADPDVSALHAGLVVAIFLYMIPAAVFHSLELMPVVLIALALVDGMRDRKWD